MSTESGQNRSENRNLDRGGQHWVDSRMNSRARFRFGIDSDPTEARSFEILLVRHPDSSRRIPAHASQTYRFLLAWLWLGGSFP